MPDWKHLARQETLSQDGILDTVRPFSPAEAACIGFDAELRKFMSRGGFPEPFLSANDADADRWRMQHINGLIRTDILDFEKIHDFRAIQLVVALLRSRAGSPMSYKSIAEDVGVASNTVKRYIQIFESLYIIFRVTPFSKNIARSILKEPKLYFFDTGLVSDGDVDTYFVLELSIFGRLSWTTIFPKQPINGKWSLWRLNNTRNLPFYPPKRIALSAVNNKFLDNIIAYKK